MIKFYDATVLAYTKLRTRRIRTLITVITSALLFSLLVAALLVSRGALISINKFDKLGFNSRYIVQANAPSVISQIFNNQQVMANATQIYNQTIAQKKEVAKTLGISYDPTTEQNPVTPANAQYGTPALLNITAPAAEQAINEYIMSNPPPGLPALAKIAANNQPIALYETTPTSSNGSLVTMFNGVENFSSTGSSAYSSQVESHDILQNGMLEFAPVNLTKTFLFRNSSAPTSAEKDFIPIIIPYSDAEYLLGLSNLPNNASATTKLNRINMVYAKSSLITFYGCYRNAASENQIQDAITTASDISANKNNPSYLQPDLIYGLPPANSCSQAPVLTDKRTADEKSDDQKQIQFDADFGTVDTPDQQKIGFRVVGLLPDSEGGAPSDSAAGILQGLVGSSLSGEAAIPENLFDQLPSYSRFNQLLGASSSLLSNINPPSYYAEFATASAARSFINDESCSQNALSCPASKPFQLGAFGSNSIGLKDLQNKFSRIFGIAGLIVIALAIVIMSSTVGRMLADGRRETAVFRAVGAKRIDISTIYAIYTVMLSVIIAVLSLIAGLAIASFIDHKYWRMFTAQAQLAFGGYDQALKFRLFSLDGKIWLISLVAIASGLLSMILPLLRNVRRSPIKDMRDE